MTASKSNIPLLTIEPKVKVEGVSKPKKHVTIKMEPQSINKYNSKTVSSLSAGAGGSSSNPDGFGTSTMKNPITPNEKILKQPNLKSIDNLNISRFYLNQPKGENDETPTRSTSLKKSHEQKKNDNKSPSHPPTKVKRTFEQDETFAPGTPEAVRSSTSVAATSALVKKPKIVKKPAPFKAIEEAIIQNNDDLNLAQIFQNIDDEMIKNKYIDFSSQDFENWSQKGITLINDQYHIVKKIIISRSKLNLQFQLIFKLVNKYGTSLENEDLVLKEKMNKLQNLGEEIKKFIS